MPEFKQFLSPKILVPVVSLTVLIVVAVLITVFYVRNPTVTDGLFAQNQDATTQSPYEAAKDGSHNGAVTSMLNNMTSSDNKTAVHSAQVVEPVVHSSGSSSGAMNSSEPVQPSSATNIAVQNDPKEPDNHTISPAPAA
ncbi:unnamed protein product [Auanema sp. JU1783]|nr:unnamed protein product [Auanema sp. JU1783]